MGRNFCIICEDFIAVMAAGTAERNAEKDLEELERQVGFLDHYRLLTKKEDLIFVSCSKCGRRPYHTEHLREWYKL